MEGQIVVLTYSLLPLPTTPIFLGAGLSKVNPIYIIPAFLVGRIITNTIALNLGKFAVENIDVITENIFSLQSIISILLSLLLLSGLFFIDWRTLIQNKKLRLDFRILQ